MEKETAISAHPLRNIRASFLISARSRSNGPAAPPPDDGGLSRLPSTLGFAEKLPGPDRGVDPVAGAELNGAGNLPRLPTRQDTGDPRHRILFIRPTILIVATWPGPYLIYHGTSLVVKTSDEKMGYSPHPW